MKHKKTVGVVIFIVAFALLLFIVPKVRADAATYEIRNFDELVEAARLSRESGHQDYTFKLKNDIEITEQNQIDLENSDFKYISFGSSDFPFAGTFDGEGHYISNLKYKSTLSPIADTGLIAYTTTGATIKNLTIKNADIQADYRGGILVGHAENTLIENVAIKDSHINISAIDNVVTLITDGGIRGGAIAGEIQNCVLYNCESENTMVNTNNTSGVAALSGKGLYLGGLVGTSIASEVEYSRVIGGLVKNYYDVVVGALGGNTLYVGGIIGQMKNGSKVIDCFSTTELYYYAATYVSVGAGNVGHVGGISAAMYGERNEIIRSHYAGSASSKQYNAALVIPIVQNNVNISGITDVYEVGSVVNTYFKPSVSNGVNMKVLGNNTSTSSYGPLSDERYVDKDYWITQNYDFYGKTKRQTQYNSNHTNKWVMDPETQMPVHGISISAALDLSNAGTVTIAKTDLINTDVSTNQAPNFAVQGFKIDEPKVATITASENEGYRFRSWYKVPDVATYFVDENHEYYDNVFSSYTAYSSNKNLNNIPIEDNDLFVAYYQARVLFHDINGSIVDINTGNTVDSVNESDWYNYLENLPEVEPNNKPTSETATLIGWTTTRSSEPGGGYSSITTPELTALKNNGTFYEAGEKITETIDLYPVYIDLISNINTVFEGHQQDSLNDRTKRDGVGYTSVTKNENGDAVIIVKSENNDSTFPEGYRFLGWYDEEGMRVSKNQEYILSDVDLTVEHTYTVRFEYSVEYYIRAFAQNNGNAFTNSELYTTLWQEYNTPFQNIPAPGYIRENITHWGTEHIDHGKTDNQSDKYNQNIVAPIKVYSHNYKTTTGNTTPYEVFMNMDFPGSGQIIDEKENAGVKFSYTPISDRYHLLFWTLERSDRNGEVYANNPMTKGTISNLTDYKGMAMVTADVNFYKKTDEVVLVTRRYESNLFLTNNLTHTYKFPYYHQNTNVSTSTEDGQTIINTVTMQASPSENDMKVDGYEFLGWISSKEVEKNGTEWNKIYDVEDDLYCTSNIKKVKPYLLDENQLVYDAIDVYPVYAKWNITTKTNIESAGSSVNIPPNPTYTLEKNASEKGEGIVTIVPNTNTYVVGNEGVKYRLIELVRVLDDGTEEKIEKTNDKYKYNVEAGQSYVFMAKYVPYTVIYHTDTDEIHVELRNQLDTIGEMPIPEYSLGNSNYVAIGWTDEYPGNKKYHYFQNYQEYEEEGLKIYTENSLVFESIELWPIYVRVQIKVNSNIDALLTENNIDLNTVRYKSRPSVNQTQINAIDKPLNSYEFEGWYINYQNSSNKGQLLTNNKTYIFESNECVNDYTYTAVYKTGKVVKYHDKTGEIIYSVNIDANESRTFVTQVTDNNNNTIEVPIDSEAYDNIVSSLASNEFFINWQWEKQNGEIVQWENFYKQNIDNSMDLYPIIRTVHAKNPDGQDVNVLVGNDNSSIDVCLNEEYKKPYITFHIEEIAYGSNGIPSTKDIEGVGIDLYKSKESGQLPIAHGVTNEAGNAKLNLYGEILITQQGETQDEDVFIYQILDKNNNVVTEINLSSGVSKTLKVSYGEYKVKRKDKWAWRYGNIASKDFTITNKNTGEEVIFEKNKVTTKWFDATTYIDNQY